MTSSWLRKWFCFFNFLAKLKHKNKWIFQQVNERKYRYLKWRMWLLKHFAWKKQGCFVPSLIEIGPVVLKRFLNSSMYFRYFIIISPLKRTSLFIWIPISQGCLVPSLLEIGPVVLKKIFKISSMYFRYFVMISPWKRACPFIWTNLNPHHARILSAKFDWNEPSGSGEEDF